MIQNPGFLSDHPQNLITGSLCHARYALKISERSVHNFLSYLADTQTNKQTNKHNRQKHYLLGGGRYEANVFKMHVHDVCSKFASCLLQVSIVFASSCKQGITVLTVLSVDKVL